MVADRSTAREIGRAMPHSLEAEEYLLSCCLLDGASVITKCLLAKLSPESFYDSKHGIVYEELLDLYSSNKPIDVSVVAEQLKTKKKLDQIGGYSFLTQVSSRIPTTAQADYFIQKVKEQATQVGWKTATISRAALMSSSPLWRPAWIGFPANLQAIARKRCRMRRKPSWRT
jgi:hypothetical protein